jgi:hypothetical protein
MSQKLGLDPVQVPPLRQPQTATKHRPGLSVKPQRLIEHRPRERPRVRFRQRRRQRRQPLHGRIVRAGVFKLSQQAGKAADHGSDDLTTLGSAVLALLLDIGQLGCLLPLPLDQRVQPVEGCQQPSPGAERLLAPVPEVAGDVLTAGLDVADGAAPVMGVRGELVLAEAGGLAVPGKQLAEGLPGRGDLVGVDHQSRLLPGRLSEDRQHIVTDGAVGLSDMVPPGLAGRHDHADAPECNSAGNR